MKYLVVFLFCISAGCKTFGQKGEDSISYLIIKIKTNWDYKNKTSFCSLDVEKGNKYANELYSLINYQNTGRQTDAVYNNEDKKEKSNFAEKKFNYFVNATEAFNYLAKLKWYLDNVFTNVSTKAESTTEVNGTFYYPVITSEPVYIFKKVIK